MNSSHGPYMALTMLQCDRISDREAVPTGNPARASPMGGSVRPQSPASEDIADQADLRGAGRLQRPHIGKRTAIKPLVGGHALKRNHIDPLDIRERGGEIRQILDMGGVVIDA